MSDQQPRVPAVPERNPPRPDWDDTIEFYTDKSGMHRYRVVGRNGRPVMTPNDSYHNLGDAAEIVASRFMLPVDEVKGMSPRIVRRGDRRVWRVMQVDE